MPCKLTGILLRAILVGEYYERKGGQVCLWHFSVHKMKDSEAIHFTFAWKDAFVGMEDSYMLARSFNPHPGHPPAPVGTSPFPDADCGYHHSLANQRISSTQRQAAPA